MCMYCVVGALDFPKNGGGRKCLKNISGAFLDISFKFSEDSASREEMDDHSVLFRASFRHRHHHMQVNSRA